MKHYLLLLFFFVDLTPCDSLKFNFSRFDHNSKDILFDGDAMSSGGVIEFNRVNYLSRVGRVTYAKRLQVWDSASRKLTDFCTHFSFIIDTQRKPSLIYGHGLSFFLAPVGFHIPPNSAAGFLGLFNTTTSDSLTKNHIMTVEFDSYPDPWDPSYEHVGINRNSISSEKYLRWNASLHSGKTANVWITYNAANKNLSVYWTYEPNPVYKGEVLLSHKIDLMHVLPEWVTIGFSAATGQCVERHVLQTWEFRSSLKTKVTKRINKGRTRLVVGLTVLAATVISVVGAALMILWQRCRNHDAMHNNSLTADFERGAGPKTFTYSELALATNNFSNDRKLGEGGFGCVYKGMLSDTGIAVAVKKISRDSRQGKQEYIAEVKAISQLRHRNLVQLIGWCHDSCEFILVYEFMPNGSLDTHLFGKKDHLIWSVRYKIVRGLGYVLMYLHEQWDQCVVHRDIKASNVMLDSSFNAKLGDFGLAQFIDHELGPQTTGVAGTLGYMAPEYIKTGMANKESDVFSFGVVVLEIVCGRKSMDLRFQESGMWLVEWVWDLYSKGKVLSAVDQKLSSDFDISEAECLLMVGLWCAHPDHHSRPSMREAVHILNYQIRIPELPSKMPSPLYHLPDGLLSSYDPLLTSSLIQDGR